MEALTWLWNILQIIIGYNLVLPLILFLLWALFPSKRKSVTEPQEKEPDYAIIVTAYQYTDNLKSVVDSITKINYNNYLVYIVADNCNIDNLSFSNEKVILLKPETIIASNTGSHFYAMERFKRPHEYVTIIDSDNLVDEEYINELNHYFRKGYVAVQGVRAAKNLDTTYSCLDAARDIYYHFYDGKILFQLGSSATLAGSGMAFRTDLYQDFLDKNQIKGAGFDKILQHFIVAQDLKIAFSEYAIVYDEKTSQSDQLVKQRARWINTWFKYFKLGFGLIGKGIRNLSLNQFLFGITLLRPPLFIFLILSIMCLLCNLIIGNSTLALVWTTAFFLFIIGFVISLVVSNTDKRIYKSLISIPKFMFFQIISLLKSKNANKHSVSTQHFHNKNIEHLNQ